MPENTEENNQEIDEFGEIAIKKIKQIQRRLSPDKITHIITMYQSGESLGKLAEQFGHSKSTVSDQLKKHGVQIRGK